MFISLLLLWSSTCHGPHPKDVLILLSGCESIRTHLISKFLCIAMFSGSFIEPPSTENISTAIKRLENVGALDNKEKLTPLGHHLAALPVDVRIGQ